MSLDTQVQWLYYWTDRCSNLFRRFSKQLVLGDRMELWNNWAVLQLNNEWGGLTQLCVWKTDWHRYGLQLFNFRWMPGQLSQARSPWQSNELHQMQIRKTPHQETFYLQIITCPGNLAQKIPISGQYLAEVSNPCRLSNSQPKYGTIHSKKQVSSWLGGQWLVWFAWNC